MFPVCADFTLEGEIVHLLWGLLRVRLDDWEAPSGMAVGIGMGAGKVWWRMVYESYNTDRS